MRVVPDCNVLVSAARIDGTCREVMDPPGVALTYYQIRADRNQREAQPAA